MDRALFYNEGELRIIEIYNSLDALIYAESKDKNGNFKFRFPQIGDFFEGRGTVLFIGSEKDCMEEKFNIIKNAR